MQNWWQKNLKLNYSKDVVDIVQFGSSIMKGSSPNDIDIAIIFDKIPLKGQLEESQKIKKQIQKRAEIPVHIKSFDFYSLLDKGNFAKESILFYGKSILNGKYFSERFGLVPKIRIFYVLKNLEKKDKVKFNYLLNGKKDSYGLLRKYGGEIISPGIVETSPENEKIFLERMKKITNQLKTEKVFISNNK